MIKKQYCSGGGSFDEKGMKIGNWIELSDGFYRFLEYQIISIGNVKSYIKVNIKMV